MNGSASLRVFISSTAEDLRAHRAVARQVILDMDWHPRMMENFGANPSITVEACRREVENCGLVLLLVSFRRGWVPAAAQGGNGRDSITALEVAHARARGIPVLAMLASDTWPGILWEDEADARAWVKDFRLNFNQPAVFFAHEPADAPESERLPGFRVLVKQVLVQHQKQLLANAARPAATSGQEYFNSACDGLFSGQSVLFISAGIYGTGPLSSRALSRALVTDVELEAHSLATCTEYWERVDGSRESFLRKFAQVVHDQETQVPEAPTVYRLLAQIPQLPLIVCTTYDRLLDEELQKAGRSYVIITHVLRSAKGKLDGRILVLRPGAKPQICRADKLDVAETEAVVYRPLGAPFLHDLVDRKLELDTVVVTERDHVTFLRRLENQHTRIPTRLSGPLTRQSLLFLGYGLDVWQYRLLMQVFHSVGPRTAMTRAVRIVDSPMEEIAWKRLNADLIRMDPNEFASSAAARGRNVDGDSRRAHP